MPQRSLEQRYVRQESATVMVRRAQAECYSAINQVRAVGNMRACMRTKGWQERQ